MKQLFYLLAVAALFTACKSGSTDSGAGAKKDSVAMPYKATYSSSFVISDSPKYAQAVLQSYKDWEDNKLSNAPAYFADTVSWVFTSGVNHKMKRDSMVKFFQKTRDSLSSSKIEVLAYTNLHSTDKKTDWVNVWYKQIDTYKTGKVDSAYYQDDNMLVKGKIVYISSKSQKLIKQK